MTMNDPTAPDFDPYADDDGRVNGQFADEVGDELAAVLNDPATWVAPPDGLGDRIVFAAIADADAEHDESGDRAGPARAPSRPSADLVDSEQPEHGDDGVAEVVPIGRGRQFRAGLLGAAAAILLLAGGVVAFRAAGEPPAQVAASAELVPTGLVPDLEGSIEVTPVRSGLRVDLDAPTLPRRDGGRYYEGWLQLDDGFLVPIGTFHEGADVTLWAGIELDRVVGMTITLERAAVGSSPDQASSGEVVLKADIVADT